MRVKSFGFFSPRLPFGFALLSAAVLLVGGRIQAAPPSAAKPGMVSYHKQIWPILQAKCQGCHQPASAGGKLVLTSYADFLKGGEHGLPVQSGKPDASPLMEYLTGKRTLMPKGGPPLAAAEIGLFRRWIAQGAQDDTPAAKDPIDADHPPVYKSPPVLIALAYAPDGGTLAVSGYREVLLHKADGSGLVARLVGKADRLELLVYSPDGKLLAAVGGAPARFGEVQFWDAATNKLVNAAQTGYDSLYGAAFSPDSKSLSCGSADSAVRIVSVPDGKVKIKFDNHSDWTFATTWATDNKHFLSTGRDRAIKLVVAENGSFVDDINTHTSPFRAMTRHPKEDQVLVAGDDGVPRLYQIFRSTPRTMNQEDHNLLREYERQPGQVNAVAFSKDGTLMAVGGESDVVNVYTVDNGGPAAPDKPVRGGKPLATLRGHKGTIHALAFRPDGKQIATGGFDGMVRIYDLPSGHLAKAFVPVPLTKQPINRAALSSKQAVSKK